MNQKIGKIPKSRIWKIPDIVSSICNCLQNMIYIWLPFDMGLDGTLISHIERVADEFDMACRSVI